MARMPLDDPRRRPAPALLAAGLPVVVTALAWVLAIGVGGPRGVERVVAGVGIVLLGVLFVRERAVSARRQEAAVEAERQLAADRATIVQLVSHEFRAPLTMIRGGVETLFARSGVDPALAPVVDAVQRATERLDGMVSMVLAAADRFEVEEHERTGTRLETVVEDVVAELAPQDVARVQVQVTSIAGVETDVARRGIVALLLQIVLDNALRFSPPHEPVQVVGHVTADEVVLRVTDHGPGMAPDFAGRAFDMFTQQDASTSRVQPGLGMGLFTARRLTSRLGGRIELANGPGGVGCVAEIRLPRVLHTADRFPAATHRTDRWYLAHR